MESLERTKSPLRTACRHARQLRAYPASGRPGTARDFASDMPWRRAL